jgi:putative nucleotidyltransferase with HDIG domain
VIPEFQPANAYELESARQPLTLDEHLFAVVQNTVGAVAPLAVRLAALLHDLGKPEADATGGSHAQLGARITARVMRRLRYPNTLRQAVVRIVAGHSFRLDGPIDALFARRFLASNGLEGARELLLHKRADLEAKAVEQWELEHLAALERHVDEQRGAVYRLGDLAVDGDDLLAIGYREGPALGAELARLLDVVIDDPAANTPDALLALAREARA